MRRRRNPRSALGKMGFPEFSGPVLVAAAASAVLVQQSFIGAQHTYADLVQMREAGGLRAELPSIRAGYVPSGVTGIIICGLMSVGTRSLLPVAVGIVTAIAMVESFEILFPAEDRLNPFAAFADGAKHILPSSSSGTGGGDLLASSLIGQNMLGGGGRLQRRLVG